MSVNMMAASRLCLRRSPGIDYLGRITKVALRAMHAVTPNVRNDRAPAREARREPNSEAVGRSGRLRGWASMHPLNGNSDDRFHTLYLLRWCSQHKPITRYLIEPFQRDSDPVRE
jgi:hypothetical protein